ncbi:MAG: hypothetical protein K2M91_02145 [Lachnospiraceae bacterium]|nr:hypothetical protein [Lachnospiraceae bacterium]
MAVERIEKYRQQTGDDILKVILKSTGKFPNGYFYCDSCDEELVRNHSWHLHKQKQSYVVARVYGNYFLRFHQEKAYNILGYYPDYINHINGVEFDNIDKNLDVVSQQQNLWCKLSKGYGKDKMCKSFQPIITVNQQHIYASRVGTEVEACQSAYFLETKYENYQYDFLKDRRNDLDILDMERTGKISEDEAVYRHVLRHAADNAWYVYRYNLFEYFKDNNLKVPAYSIDDEGYMTHPITGQRLCPL